MRYAALFTLVLLGSVGCGNAPSEPDPVKRWVQASSFDPEEKPYGIYSHVEVRGTGLAGIKKAYLLESGGVREGLVLEAADSRVRIGVPTYEWFGRLRVIVSEGSEPYHQRDTVPGHLKLVGPAAPDERVYEYRSPTGETFHWARERFPLRVHLPAFQDSANVASARAGVLSWEDAIGPGFPAFQLVSDSASADIVFRSAPVRDPTICFVGFDREGGAADHLRSLVQVVVTCKREWASGGYNLRDTQVIAGHEVGHALGLLRHSKRPDDIMGIPFTGDRPGEADRLTLRHLYGSIPR